MRALLESYKKLYEKAGAIHDKIGKAQEEIRKLTEDTSGETALRIERLETQLKKIDDYLPRIKGFQELAKKNLESQNVLTIEAPPGYRVNLNRLRNWAMMIDPSASNDPYAQRVFIVAKCDECFLEQKKKEFQTRIEELKNDTGTGVNEEVERIDRRIASYNRELDALAASGEMAVFAKEVVTANDRYRDIISPVVFENPQETWEKTAPGARGMVLPFTSAQHAKLKELMGEYYDPKTGRVMLPFELDNRREQVITITCAPSRRKYLDRSIQQYLLTQLNTTPAGSRKLYVLDGTRFNSAAIGSLRKLEDSFVMEKVPRNPEQMTTILETLVSSFADDDEQIEQYDSVAEYNEAQEDSAKKITMKTVLLIGWPNAFEGRDRELLQRIMVNYERYGVSLMLVRYDNSDREDREAKRAIPEYALQNAVHISVMQKETTVTMPEKKPEPFVWYRFGDDLTTEYVESLKRFEKEKKDKQNEYTLFYSLTDLPPYVRTYKELVLPFGVDGRNRPQSISFENENFAAYLVGASRSGKSTLLHTLIAGMIRNYHPDNLELWLADFKQLEFKRYMKHLPPHVKYVLLDESQELVFDLIDKLTAKMMERQKLFSRIGIQRINQINPATLERPLPLIFVILDEFSIMSQSIEEDSAYKLKLQNILAKGAALGIRFLFSSQTFTSGVAGLTPTARAQIQQRIAMKGSRDEISETLELSASLKTQQVQNWMDALPVHRALVKFRKEPTPDNEESLPEVRRYLVMFIDDYGLRDRMIDRINAEMSASENYNPSDIGSYVDKHPVCVDGNTFDAFDEKYLMENISAWKRHKGDDLTGDEVFLSFGTPRLMERMKLETISDETRENILLVSRAAEQTCAMSVILSSIRAFLCQNGKAELWVYGKHPLYRSFRKELSLEGVTIVENLDQICDAIAACKKRILNKETDRKLIVMIGMDRICGDFEFADGGSAGGGIERSGDGVAINPAAYATTEEEQNRTEATLAWFDREDELRELYASEGKSEEEMESLLDAEMTEFFAAWKSGKAGSGSGTADPEQAADNQTNGDRDTEQTGDGQRNDAPEQADAEGDADTTKETATGAYNALDDLQYVLTRGSRMGYHFLLHAGQLGDVKLSGAKTDWFRHRISFQVSKDDASELFQSRTASTLPEHVCQYSNQLDRYSFRPYLHPGVVWEGWDIGADGNVISPFGEEE